MPEPEDWFGVSFDVAWFQRQGKASRPLP
jgi:hypothetical protein